MKADCFCGYHPVVALVYFVLAIGGTMALGHPVCLGLSMAAAFSYRAMLEGRQGFLRFLRLAMAVFLGMALFQPAFSHEGVTILTYLPSGNPLTLESICFGIGAGALLVTAMAWFYCLREVMTAEKWMYLFGKVVPAFSLLLSMAMRFLPLFLHQAKEISRAQRCMGRDGSMGSLWHRAKCSVRMCSILILWALENAIETADSMKSRGYGLPGRTAYSRYEWEERDKMALWYMAFAAALLFVFGHGGSFVFRYYPSIVLAGPSIWNGSGWVCFGALLFLPHGLEWRENRLWQRRKVEVGE